MITGNKYWCTFADGADFILVLARTDAKIDPKRRHAGISAFIVEKERGTLPANVSGAPIPKIGYFGWKTWELAFDGCRVPAANMVGEEGKGFYLATQGLEIARAHTAARAIGLARGALEDAIAYAKERVQFGRAIGEFQAIRFKIASMATEIEAARALLYSVCNAIDTGKRADLEASMAKLFATEMAERVTSEALQIHGGAGYTTLHCRRALLARRAAHQDLRRHVRDPDEDHFRPPPGQAGKMTETLPPPMGTYFEDFAPGQLFRHARGKTVGEIDVVLLAQMSMNTAQGHFNNHAMAKDRFGRRIAYGGVTAALVVGLASEDTAEHAIAELGIRKLRLRTPVVEGDTLYAITETLDIAPADRPDAGIVTFRHVGINQDDELVCEIERRTMIRRRPGAAA